MLNLRRKLRLMHSDQSGQSMVFVALTLFMMFLFVCVTVDVGDFVAQKIDVQNDADAMALSTAVWQARGLNLIQTLNVAKNLAHIHYIMELTEVLYWAGASAACGPPWNPFCWPEYLNLFLSILWYDEGIVWEKPELEDELGTLTTIQRYIAGTGSMEGLGSTENFIILTIPFIDINNNDGNFNPTSIAVNETAAFGVFYDPNLRIEFRERDSFVFIIFEIFEDLFGWEIDDELWEAIQEVFNGISGYFEVRFDWAVQSDEYVDEQYTVGFAVRPVEDGPMFSGRFQAKTLISQVIGGLPLFDTEVHLALAQAKPFKPDRYTLRPGSARNGVAANLLGLPFPWQMFGLDPEPNNEALWDVKLTPVTMLDSIAPILSPVLTH